MGKSNQLVLSKLRQAQHCLQKVINIFQSGSSSLEVIKQSQRTQGLLKEANSLMAKDHLNICVADFIKKGKIENATKEIKRLHRYNF